MPEYAAEKAGEGTDVYKRQDVEFKAGHKMRGDFYKCGDKTAQKHYGSFTPIDWPTPNFHRPEFFADMVIVD